MEIRLTPSRELFFNQDNFFGIYACWVNKEDVDKVQLNSYGNISIKGVAPQLEIGSEYVAILAKDSDSKYEGSYILESINQDKPVTLDDQKKFFQMILTERQVENIFEVYEGQDVIGMIQDGTLDYSNIKGIGDKTFEKMREKVLNNLDMGELLVFLAKHDIKYNMVAKLVKEYGSPQIVIEKISTNPYVLTEVKGIGFIRADTIAKAMKYDMHSPHRIHSCVKYCIGEENANGHSWIERRQLVNKAVDLLSINRSYVADALDNGIKGVVDVEGRFTTKSIYEAEKYVAMRMVQYKTQSRKVFETDKLEEMIDEYSEKHNIKLEESQRKFFHDWNENAVMMLVGGGGVGKSWLQNILLSFVKQKNLRVSLLAPTGK